jgi:uncharacterized protein DUF4333
LSFSGLHLALLALVAVGLFATGCGETLVDDVKTEGAVKQNVEAGAGPKVSSVDCPSDIKVEPNTTFRCTVTLEDGKEQTATLEIRNDDADLSLLSVTPASQGG